MRILVISDLHGDLVVARKAVARFGPELVLCCGDWGDPEQLQAADLEDFTARVPTYSTFGNHDATELLGALKNADGSPVLLPQGERMLVHGLRVAAIGGIWAKSHAKPFYVTDADVAECASRVSGAGPVEVLLTHGCPVGLADLTPSGRHGGQRCFLEANKTIGPRLHLCGHLHVAQERTMKDGRQVINVGATPEGWVALIDFEPEHGELHARLERLEVS